jgi:hypothetical protein
MSRGTVIRLVVTILVIGAIFTFAWRTKLNPERVSLLFTAAICAATVLYVSLTFEILLRNQSMANAASDSAILMERGLRFSHAANLHYRTIINKDLTLQNKKGCTPVENDDYANAMRLTHGSEQQLEFVFCVVQNVGHGAATNLRIEAEYKIQDTSNPITHITVPKAADVQLLESGKSVALLIYLFKVPTTGDKAEIVQALMRSSDAYRDAIQEKPITITINSKDHHFEADPGCIARLS